MRLTADWLTSAASQAVCGALADGGFQAYFVGGCVRNAIIDAPVSDLDICTDARPEQTLKQAELAGLKAIPTGIDHGTITIIADGIPYEVTTFRRDVETDGRHAKVAFSDTLEEDAERRDFTMNALYCDASGQVIDPVGGLPDLQRRHVRFIGEPDARIQEDYLRILRFFRFTAWYGDDALGIDADGLSACAVHSDGLSQISAERIGAEMRKLLSAPDPSVAVASMQASGVLAAVLPGASAAALPVLVHIELDEKANPIRRLAVMGGENMADRLRFSNAERKEYDAIRAGLETDLEELGYRFKETCIDTYLVRQALMGQPIVQSEIDQIKQASRQEFPVRAADLMPAYSGAALGAKLKELEQKWISSGFSLTKSQLCDG